MISFKIGEAKRRFQEVETEVHTLLEDGMEIVKGFGHSKILGTLADE